MVSKVTILQWTTFVFILSQPDLTSYIWMRLCVRIEKYKDHRNSWFYIHYIDTTLVSYLSRTNKSTVLQSTPIQRLDRYWNGTTKDSLRTFLWKGLKRHSIQFYKYFRFDIVTLILLPTLDLMIHEFQPVQLICYI